MEEVDHEEVLKLATDAAKKAGELMLQGFNAVKEVTIKTASHDIVTEYDKKTENIITSEIRKKFPNHRIVGEESTNVANVEITDEPTWIIDPIDGTTNYVHGFHESAISIGFAVKKEVTVGVIYNPILDNLFTAAKGKGAFQNGKKIQVSKCTDHSKSLVATEISFALLPENEHKVLERLRGLVSGAHGARSVGSAATTLCYIANGSLDIYVQDGLCCWDVAAGVILIREAGGIVMQSNGEPFDLRVPKILAVATLPLAKKALAITKEADERARQKL